MSTGLTDDEWTAAAWDLANELDQQRLDVSLVEAPRRMHAGHMVRRVDGRNPKWYRRFCETMTVARRRPRNRRVHDTLVRRQWVVRALAIIAKRIPFVGVYHARVLPIVERRAIALRSCPPH